ncbi:MAG: hypothetical protein IPM92_14675 [Saprospiraceae bacterium]|nr:hypothetical protein [Saprospiraceae bacterium]
MEAAHWGGGRGVFSYYLLKGLNGLADKNKDQMVSLFEIERYLEDEVTNAVAPQKQLPMAVGNKASLLTKVRSSGPTEESEAGQQNQTLAQARGTLNDFSNFKNPNISKLYQAFAKSIADKRMIYPKDSSAWDYLTALEKEPETAAYLQQWKYQLAAAMVDETQQAINDYLKSDPVELRKRWSFNERYERYPEYLEKAASILGTEHKLYSILQSRKHYYEGLKLRLKGERSKNINLFETARMQQLRCIELDPDAAFAYNELGLLERRKSNSKEAIRYFQKALSLSPGWALAWTNLSACFNDLELLDSAIFSGLKAIELDNKFALAHYNLGSSYQMVQQFDLAIENLMIATQLDTTYANAYFNLSLTYYHSKKYPEAKKAILHYLELKPNDPDALINLGEIELKLEQTQIALAIFNDVLRVHPENPAALQSLGEYYRSINQLDSSDAYFKRITEKAPLVYFYLASNASLQNHSEISMEYFKQAFSQGFNKTELMKLDKGFEKMRDHQPFVILLQQYFPNLSGLKD